MLTDNPKFLLLATDGEPSCPDDDDDEDVDAVDYTVDAIAEALAKGFRRSSSIKYGCPEKEIPPPLPGPQ